MRGHSRSLLLIAALVAFPLRSNSATRQDLVEAAKKEREVVLYTTTNLEEASAMGGHFKAKYPFLDVNVNRAEGERIVTKILQETRAKNPCGRDANAGVLSPRIEEKGNR